MKAKTKLTKLWSILLALVMVVGMLPTVALAAEPASDPADFSANPTAALALLNAAKTADAEDSTWDSTTKTLTLNGVNFTTTASTAVKLPEAATIVLNGDNTITSGVASSKDSFGIYALGDLTINGDGKLTVTSGTANDDSHGIYACDKMSITGNVIATSGTANDRCYGIHAGDSIAISGNVTAIGGEAGEYSHGIHAVNNLTIEGGNVTAAGGTAMNANSYGIYAYYDINISGGTVIATGGAADGYSLGIYASKNVFVSGTADVTAEGGSAAENDSNGICASYYVTITGGSVKATGGTANSLSVGISADNDAVTISGDNTVVTATGGTATKDSYGIYSNGDTKISGGTTKVTATGGTVNATGGTAGSGYDSCGICANDNVIIEDGIVSAKGGKATDDSYGICAYKNVTIKSGTVNATGGAAQMTEYSMSGGIQGSNYIAIEGGIVEATGGAAWISCGFSIVALGRMDIKGGTVTATGGTSTEKGSYGIYTNYSAYVNITGGSLIAKAGSAPSAKALPWAPWTLPAIYWWRSSDSGQYKNGSFNWGDVSTYVEIRDTEPITTYTVTFDANGGTGTMADVTGVLGDYTLPANGFTAPGGKQFKAWSVNGTEKAVGDKITVSADTTVKAVWEKIPAAPIEYEILDGANSSWTQNSDGSLSIRGSGAFSEFVGVKVDGKSVDEKYYTVKEGSTIVTLKADYLNTLTVGSHTLEIVWTDGSASTIFTIEAESPQTGDNSMMALWIAVLFVSGFGVVATAVYGKKRKSVK